MRLLRPLLFAAATVLCLTGMQKKPEFTLRFHVEANKLDTERFARPIDLKYPPRKTYIERTPSLSERHVLGIYPFEAADGSFGCLFKLDADGRIALESLTTQRRGSSLVAFVGTDKGVHQVIDMVIDKPVRDGVIMIQSGLTPLEVTALKKRFKPVLPKGTETAKPPKVNE